MHWKTCRRLCSVSDCSQGRHPQKLGQFKIRVKSHLAPLLKEFEAMKRSRFTELQVAHALRQAEAGTPVIDVCRGLGISEATFYIWKKKYSDWCQRGQAIAPA